MPFYLSMNNMQILAVLTFPQIKLIRLIRGTTDEQLVNLLKRFIAFSL